MWDLFFGKVHARTGAVGKDAAVSPKARKKGKLAVSNAAAEALEGRVLLSISSGQPVNFSATAGTPYSGPVATFAESDPTATASNYTASITYSNGAFSSGTVTGSAGAFTVNDTQTFANAGAVSASISVTDNADGSTTSATDSIAVSPAPFTISASDITIANDGSPSSGDTFGGTIATISSYAGAASDYSGIITVNDNSYSLYFYDNGSGVLQIQSDNITLPPGNYTAQLNVTDTVSTLSTSSGAAFNIWAVQPLTAEGASSNSSTYGVPWSGPVATFNDDSAFHPVSSYTNHVSATVVYSYNTAGSSNGFTSSSSTLTGGSGSWTVNDAQTFPAATDFSVQTNIADTQGQSASVTSDVNVSLPAFSVTGQSPTVVEGQLESNVVIGTLTDTAGDDSIASDFSAVYTIPVAGGTSYPSENLNVALVPDSPNDGVYTLKVLNLPQLPANQPAGVLYVSETAPGASNGVSTGVGINVTPYNTVHLMQQTAPASIEFHQPGPVTIADYWDALDSYGSINPSTYSATLVLNGQNYGVTFGSGDSGAMGDGTVNLADGSGLAPGTYTGTLTVTNDPGAGQSQCSVEIDVADAAPTPPSIAGITGTEGAAWSGTIATFAMSYYNSWSNMYVTPSDFTATINYGDGAAPQTGTITGTYQGFTVTDAHTFAGVDSTIAVTITENAGTATADQATSSLAESIAPAAPTALSITETDANRINLQWTNNSAGASDFYILRSDDGGTTYNIIDDVTAIAGTNTYSDTSIQPNPDGSGNTYSYLVMANSPLGNVSAMSNVVTTTTPTAGVVDPTGTEISPTQIDLAWTPIDATVPVEVWRSTDGVNFTQLTLPTSGTIPATFSDNGLTPGTKYYYKIRGNDPGNSDGPTGYTDITSYSLPAAATGLTATSTDGQSVQLTWTNNSGSSTVFEIQRADSVSTDFQTIDQTDPGASSYTDSSINPGSNYQYQVLADSADDGGSTPSNVAAFLAQPTELTATAVSASEIDLSWTSDPNSGINILRSTSASGPFTTVHTVSGTNDGTYSDTGLTAGAHYYYKVQATNGSDVSLVSDPADDITAPDAPTISSVTAASSSELDVAWNAVTGALGYDIQRMAEDGTWQPVTQIEDGDTTTYNDPGLIDGVNYSYQVDAFNNAGTSDMSAAASQTTLQTLPAPPSALHAVAISPTAVQLVWQDGAYNETGFYVQKSLGGDDFHTIATLSAGATTYTDTTLSPGEGAYGSLCYQVVAYNSAGDSSGSDYNIIVTAQTPDAPTTAAAAPAAPEIGTFSQSGGLGYITFSAGAGGGPVTGYTLERSVNAGNFAVATDIASSSAGEFVVSDLYVPGNSYSYKVVAVGPGGRATASACGTYTVPAPTPAVANLVIINTISGYAAPDGHTVTGYADWSNDVFDGASLPSDPPTGFTTYFYAIDAELNIIDPTTPSGSMTGSAAAGATQAWATDSTLPVGHYEYFSYLSNGAGQSAVSSGTGYVAILPNGDPETDLSLSAAQDTGIPDRWNIDNSDSAAAWEYSADYGTVGTALAHWYSVDSVPGSLDVAPGAGAEIRVDTFNQTTGITNYSSAVGISSGESIPQPGGLTAVPVAGSKDVTVSWDGVAPTDSADEGIDGHYIMLERSSDGTNFQLVGMYAAGSGTTTVTNTPPNEDTTYEYRIREMVTVNGLPVPGYSPYSDTATVTTSLNAPKLPSYPDSPLIMATPTELGIQWIDASNHESSTTVEARPWTGSGYGDPITFTVGPDAGACTLTGLTPNTNYYIHLQNVAADGTHSPWTEVGLLSTKPLPTVTISNLQDASELAPDGTPGKGYFLFTRDSQSYSGNIDSLPALTVSYTVNTSAEDAATPDYEYTALSGSVTIPAGAVNVVVPVTPKEIEYLDGNKTVTAALTSGSGYTAGTPSSATMTITNTDAETVTVSPPLLSVGNPETIPVKVTNFYDRQVPDATVNVTQYDPTFVTLSETSATTDSSGVAHFLATALVYGTMGELFGAVASASPTSVATSPLGSAFVSLKVWGICAESVANGVAVAELPKVAGGTRIYVPESHGDLPAVQSAASYWAPFIVHLSSADPLAFTFDKNLRVNTNADGSGTVIVSGVPQNLVNDQVLYVGATDLVTNESLNVFDTVVQPTRPFDHLTVTSFRFLGPNDVPQFGTYEYTTVFGGAIPTSAGWEIATGGAMAVRARPHPNPSDAFVTWGAGPLVGTALYDVTPNFSWHLNVNIVQVSVTTPTNIPPFVPGTATQQSPQVADTMLVSSDNLATPGLTWNADVTFTGPNGNQGVRHIMAGFVQNLKVTSYSGTYGTTAPFGTATPYFGGRRMVGATFWDHINTGYRKFYAPYSRPAAFIYGADQLANPTHVLITSSDSPGSGPPVSHLSKQLSAMALIWDFNLFVAATTDEATNVYAGQALTTWRFNASGNLNPSKVWTSTAPRIITPPTPWVPLTRDSDQPIVDTTPFNNIIQDEHFADRWK